MKANERNEFRNSIEWKTFRARLMTKQKYDYITGEPLTETANCHHLRLDHEKYNDLSDENAFIMLNKASHEKVHQIYNTGKWQEEVQKIKECPRKDKLIEVMKMMDKYNTDSTEVFLFSNHIEYTFDESNKPLVAELVRWYKIPNRTDWHGQNQILWSQTTKETPRDMPEETKAWFNWICKRNSPNISPNDRYTILQLRHLGLYSSYKNIKKKDRSQQWVINIMNKLETEIKMTTKCIKFMKEKYGKMIGE